MTGPSGARHRRQRCFITPVSGGECAYFTTWCPHGTSIDTLVRVEGTRWWIEEGFETAKNELGLDHNETRSWHGWHHHVSLAMLAYAIMAAVRYRANTITPKKRSPGQERTHPMARPRNPPSHHEARSAPTARRAYPEMINIQKGPPSRSQKRPP